MTAVPFDWRLDRLGHLLAEAGVIAAYVCAAGVCLGFNIA